MAFNSVDFMIFFPIVVFIFYIIPKKIRYIWLLISSYYFYMSWNPKYAVLMLTSTLITYVGSLLLNNRYVLKIKTGKKLVLGISILLNLVILVYFKYSNFILDSVESVLWKYGIRVQIPSLDIILPVGISFYTFQALGYAIDVYRGTVKAERNFLKYALFVSFFPQLVAGPIERSKNLLNQIKEIDVIKFDISRIYHGLFYMMYGLFLKMVIADRIKMIVDNIFANYYLFGGIELIIGSVAFSIQIYCDFFGYSVIAVGVAEILGFQLMENFKAPFLSKNIHELWRRWHISLSSWFRDYLYIPLGGNRRGTVRKYFNLLITFMVSGLWHGAGVTYIIWGALNGIFLILEDMGKRISEKLKLGEAFNTQCLSFRFLRRIVTFTLFSVSFIFFRAENVKIAVSYFKRIFVDFNPWILGTDFIYHLGLERIEIEVLVIALVILLIADVIRYHYDVSIVDSVLTQNALFQYVCFCGLIMFIIIFGIYGPAYDSQSFIYFQF